ncbi:unnamed protein product, partial [Coregonus sp. 'balchen']
MLDPFYRQALARFYYIKVRDYDKAEKEAIEATRAFKQEEELAGKEKGAGIKDYSIFNNRGHFGFLQVANTVFDSLTKITQTWENLLTQEMPAEHLPQLFKDRKLEKYKPLLASLRDDVERKLTFFERYLTYSEPSNLGDQPPYFQREINDCYANFIITPRLFHAQKPGGVQFQKLQEEIASTFPGLLSCVNRNTRKSELQHITELWRTIYDKNKSGNVNIAYNYILVNILANGPVTSPEPTILPQLRVILQKFIKEDNRELWTPEFYLLVLLLFWPEEGREEDVTNDIDLNMYVGLMKLAYNSKYKKYIRSRELVSLFYLGRGDGLRRLVQKSEKENQWEQSETEGKPGQFSQNSGRRDGFQNQLVRVNGVVREHKTQYQMPPKAKMTVHSSTKGCYECTVSELRWVCESNVILKYHYRNWEPYSQLLKHMQYTQGGPLLDITMEFGTNPSLMNVLKILYVEEHRVSFKEVHEVTRFHVKLLRPEFSALSLCFPSFWDVEVHCEVVLYLAVKEATLISRLYLLLRNSGQQEAVQKREKSQMSKGFSEYLMSSPKGPLKLRSHFALHNPNAKSIRPQKIQLLPDDVEPSRFKMVMDKTGIDNQMELIGDDGNIFLKNHRAKIIQSATNAMPIADALLSKDMIGEEEHSKIASETTDQEQMRKLLKCVILKGQKVVDAFLHVLCKQNRFLIEDMVQS